MTIRFVCPACHAVMKAPDRKAGRKAPCPKCGQRLQVPQPRPALKSDKTVLGKPLPAPPRPRSPVAGLPVTVACPGCPRHISLLPHEFEITIECAGCGRTFVPADVLAPVDHLEEAFGHADPDFVGGRPSRQGEDRPVEGGKQHSGLGIASFLIAILVGGLNIILALVVAVGIAKSTSGGGMGGYTPREDLLATMLGGGVAMVCLNVMTIPFALVGCGLGVVALITQKGRNQTFTWIGLMGNASVVFGVLGLYVCGSLLGG